MTTPSAGFPIHLIEALRCTLDGGFLRRGADCVPDLQGTGLLHGQLECERCGNAHPVVDGIVNLLGQTILDEESRHEQSERDREAAAQDSQEVGYHDEHNRMEIEPTLAALDLNPEHRVLELGCGDGRYTVLVAPRVGSVVALDFSLVALRSLRRRLGHAGNVGLVLADVATAKFAPGFDRVVSTLISNLPTVRHREAMLRLGAAVLKRDGRMVYSAHHLGLWQRLRRERKSGYYHRGGIYRYLFSVSECRAEARRYFARVKARPIQIYFPLVHRLGVSRLKLSRVLERFPVLNRLGALVLCTVEKATPPAS